MAFTPTPLSFHPLMVDLDLNLSRHLAAAAEQRRQEWEYTQHLMDLRQQQQAAAERCQLVEAYAAAAAAKKELERRLLLEQEQRRRQAQLQAQAQLNYQYHHQQQQQERQRAARRRRQQQQQHHQAQQRALARQSAEWRRLSHILDSLTPTPEMITRLHHHHHHLDENSGIGGVERDDEEQEQEAVVVPPSPAEIFFQLYGDADEEEVVLKHKQPSSGSAVSAAAADPEEVDLAAAAFAAAAAEEGEEQEDTTAADERDASSEAGSVDSDLAEALASTPTDDEVRIAALEALTKLAQDFTARRRAFVSPASLSFQPAPVSIPSSTSRSPTPPLAFESNNTPFLGYEDFLVSLLSRIDAVESHGIGEVKMARKNLVKEVEQELARLDDLKDQAWERLSASSSSTASGSSQEEGTSDSEASGDDDEDTDMLTFGAAEGESSTLAVFAYRKKAAADFVTAPHL